MSNAKLAVATILVGALACSQTGTDDALPPTPRLKALDMIGGRSVPNPYAWLEELESESVRAWVDAQDARTMADLALALENSGALADRLSGHAKAKAVETPVRRGDAFFFMVDSSAHASPALFVHQNGEDRLLVDPADFSAVGLGEAQIADFRVSSDGACTAVVGAEPSSGHRSMRIIDTFSGTYLSDAVAGAQLADQPWITDCRSIVYSTGEGDRPASTWRHDVGVTSDVRIHPSQGRENLRLTIDAVEGGFVVVERRQPRTFEALWVAGAEPYEPEVILTQNGGRVLFIGAADSALFFHVEDTDGGSRIVAAHHSAGTFRTDSVLDLSGSSVSTAHLYGGRIVLNGASEDGAPTIRVHALEGAPLEILTPPFGLLWTNFPAGRAPVLGDWEARYAYTNSLALDAPGIYEIDLEGLTLTPWRLRRSGTATDILVKRIEYAADDGVTVPMSLTYHADTPLDGSAPALAWVYGAHGFTATPFFSGFFRAFIEAGGVLAMPQVRGGGAFGPEWYAAGSRANKRNTISDTIDALEWLIDNDVTGPDRLAILGNSAGSVPAAAVAIDRPDLVGAVILEIPLADMVRHKQWSGGWSTEFGDPEIPEELDALLEFSPYQALLQARELPATLIFAGENDTTAPPHHAFKLAASMQHAQTGNEPVYLRLMRGAGHQVGVNKIQRTENQALQLAFLTREIGLRSSFQE